MKVVQTEIPEVLLFEPDVLGDARGYCFESYSVARYRAAGLTLPFVQDNVSRSARGILRAMHLQSPPSAQGKLVSVALGEVYDVALDLRVGSQTFGKHVARYLSQENRQQLYVPPGFAHGFCVTSDEAVFTFKCTAYYDPSAELTIAFDDPDLNIAWPVHDPVVAPRDRQGYRLRDLPLARLVRAPAA
jgi:dTDP-4-dehydrorhamnose 3,5-epimerase